MRTAPGFRQLFPTRVAVLIVVLAVTTGVSSGAASPALDYATQVGYFSSPGYGYVNWYLDCVADDPSIQGPIAIADGDVSWFGGMSGGISYYPRYSRKGSYVQVGNAHVVTVEERETDSSASSSTFGWGGGAGGTFERAYVVFALWASTARCVARVNGHNQPITYLDGSHASLVGPEAFGTGILVQDGSTHVPAARTYTTGLKGGPAWVAMSMNFWGEGSLHFDDQVTELRECRQPDGNPCEVEAPAASSVTATMLGGAFQGEMIVITLPPGAFDLL